MAIPTDREKASDDHLYFALSPFAWGSGTTPRGAVQNARFSGSVAVPKEFNDWMIRLAPDVSRVERDTDTGFPALAYPQCECGDVRCVGHRAYLMAKTANDERS